MTHTFLKENRDPVRALHDAVEAAPGGLKEAARGIGRSPGVLYNKFSEADPRYDVTVREAVALARWAQTQVFAEAVAEQFGGVFVPLPDGESGESDLLQAQLDMMEKFGELAREFTESRRDGLITSDEVAVIRVVGNRLIRSVHAFVKEVESQVQPSPASPLHAVGDVTR